MTTFLRLFKPAAPVLLATAAATAGPAVPPSPAGGIPAPNWKPTVTLLVSADLQGETEPCGCQHNPRGGLAKKAFQLGEMKKEGAPVWFVDAGNSLFKPSRVPDFEATKADIVATALLEGTALLEPVALGVGHREFSLGSEWLMKTLARHSGLPWVATNLNSGEAHSPFKEAVVKEVAGKRVAFFALLREETTHATLSPWRTAAAAEALSKAWAALQPSPDFSVLFSEMEGEAERALVKSNPNIHLIVRSERGAGRSQVIGNALVLDLTNGGKQVARVDLDLSRPWNVSSLTERIEDEERLAGARATLATYRAKGDPEQIYADNPGVLRFYRQYVDEEARLAAQLAKAGVTGDIPYRLTIIDIPKDGPDEPAVGAIVGKAKKAVAALPGQPPPNAVKAKPYPGAPAMVTPPAQP